MKARTIHYRDVAGFRLFARYAESNPAAPENHYDSHIHTDCEIYIHVSGDVSFMVEDNVYPVLPGHVIITRPYEYHHCIYRSNALHKHFCIFFSAEGNEPLLDVFFRRAPGEKNLLTLSYEDTEKLLSLCHEMIDEPSSALGEHFRFFELMRLLNTAETHELSVHLYPDVTAALGYINAHLSEKLSIQLLAKNANVSINTLERHFMEKLHLSPSDYLRQKRLAKAMELLSGPCNVTEACEKCGFSDCSAFIAQFKKAYGVTPLQYKKNCSR